LAKAGRKLDELAATLARGKTRRPRHKVGAEIGKILHHTWARRVITWRLAGDTPKDHRLTLHIDPGARAALEEEIFGKHVLITDHDDWPAAEVIAAYRPSPRPKPPSGKMKDPRVASFSPMFHWTEHNIVVHVFTCVLALQLAHLMRRPGRTAPIGARPARRARRHRRDRPALPGDRGRPRAHRMLTDTTPAQDKLIKIFGLDCYAPKR
jgi:hypothetical protein